MNQAEITHGVIKCVAESLARPAEGIRPETRLIPDLNADSLDFLDIMFALERTFGISVGKEQFDLLHKVGMSKEEAIVDQNLTPAAIARLKNLLPSLPSEGKISVRNLRDYITIATVAQIVQDLRAAQSKG